VLWGAPTTGEALGSWINLTDRPDREAAPLVEPDRLPVGVRRDITRAEPLLCPLDEVPSDAKFSAVIPNGKMADRDRSRTLDLDAD
jgi:hypothetical protein